MNIPFIDWNGNGAIDPSDIAVSLAMNEEDNGINVSENNNVSSESSLSVMERIINKTNQNKAF